MQVEFLQEFKTTEDIGLPPKVQGGIVKTAWHAGIYLVEIVAPLLLQLLKK